MTGLGGELIGYQHCVGKGVGKGFLVFVLGSDCVFEILTYVINTMLITVWVNVFRMVVVEVVWF